MLSVKFPNDEKTDILSYLGDYSLERKSKTLLKFNSVERSYDVIEKKDMKDDYDPNWNAIYHSIRTLFNIIIIGAVPDEPSFVFEEDYNPFLQLIINRANGIKMDDLALDVSVVPTPIRTNWHLAKIIKREKKQLELDIFYFGDDTYKELFLKDLEKFYNELDDYSPEPEIDDF